MPLLRDEQWITVRWLYETVKCVPFQRKRVLLIPTWKLEEVTKNLVNILLWNAIFTLNTIFMLGVKT